MKDFFKIFKIFSGENKGFSFISVGHLVGNFVGGAFWLVLAFFAEVQEYGEISYFLAIGAFFISMVILGGTHFLITFIAKQKKNVQKEISSIVLISSVSVSIIIFIFFNSIPLSLLIIGGSFYAISLSELIGLGRFKEYAILFISQKVLNLILSMVLFFIIGIDGIIYGFAISYIILSYRGVYSLKNFTFSFSLIRKKKRFMLGGWGLNLSESVGFSIDKFFIGPIFGFATLGTYHLGIQFLLLLSVIPTVMYSYLLREEARGINRKYIKIYGVALTLFISLIVMVLSPHFIPIVFPKFIESIPLIQIAVWGAPLMTLISIFNTEFLGNEKIKPVLVSAGIFVLILYPSIFFIGTILGPIGLVIGLIIALGCHALSLYVFKKSKNIS